MKKIFFLTLLNFKVALKEKTFWVIGLLLLFLMSFSFFLGQLTLGEKGMILKAAGLSVIELTALLLIIFGFIFNFYKEKETRLQEVYLSHFSSLTYLGAKLAGYILVCFFYILIAFVFLTLVLRGSFDLYLLSGVYGIFLKLSIFSGLALLFSAVFNYPLLSAGLLFFTYIGAELAYGAYRFAEFAETALGGFFLRGVYYLLPNADKLDFKYLAIHSQAVEPSVYLFVFAYTVIYILFCFFLANLFFSIKEH